MNIKRNLKKKNFNEVLIIIIDSYESFIEAMKDHNNNFLKEFNENLYIEEQPFLLFLNKNPNDFDYSTYTSKDYFQYNNYKYFEEECIDFISEKKEDHNIEIYYDIEYSDIAIINTFLDKKEKNKDNFHVIFGNNQ